MVHGTRDGDVKDSRSWGSGLNQIYDTFFSIIGFVTMFFETLIPGNSHTTRSIDGRGGSGTGGGFSQARFGRFGARTSNLRTLRSNNRGAPGGSCPGGGCAGGSCFM